jgi:hypothetical protein
MAGHSKWSQIKHKKAVVDAKRGKEFSKLARLITVESRLCGGDTSSPSLKTIMDKAKAANMPKENIERAVLKGAGGGGESLERAMYEFYGPGGVAVIVTVTTDNTNRNVNSTTSENVNRNINSGEVTNRNINENRVEQTVKSPPPTAVAPAMMSGGNSDLCTTGTSGAVQTQILGVSSGGTVRDLNCERLKNAKTLYDMGMKVAAVATLCQDRRVFDAMWNAGTPCPYEGMIGAQARAAWEANPDRMPQAEEIASDDFYKKTTWGAILGYLLFLVL